MTITVGDLKKSIADLPDDAEVIFSADYMQDISVEVFDSEKKRTVLYDSVYGPK